MENLPEKWVVQCFTQEQWDEVFVVLNEKDPDKWDYAERAFEEHENGYGVDSDGEHCEIDYYDTEYPEYKVLSVAEFLGKTSIVNSSYTIF